MRNADTSVHQRVRRIVARDLGPVKPLPSPGRRAFMIAPLALLVAVLAALRYGVREDFNQLGGAITWGFSALQWTIGLLVLALALREAIPGSGISRRMLAAIGALTAFAVLAITVVTYDAHPTFVPPSLAWPMWYLCFLGPLEFGTPILILSTILAARAFPTRPSAAGALSGLAAGLITDSGWRLTCWITVPAHVLGTHLLAVGTLVVAGAALGVVIDRVRD
jgi:hypothetical protein